MSKQEPASRRTTLRHHAIAAGICLLGMLPSAQPAAQPVSTSAGLDAAALRRFGGTYAAACADAAAPRLRVTAGALVVEQGGQRMTGRKPSVAHRHVGHGPPPKHFELALTSEVRGGLQLIFLAHADATGPFLRLDGDPTVTAALGQALTAATYRRCGPAALETAPAASPGGVPPMAVLTADPAFKRAYRRALGPLTRERWLARLEGPSAPTREQRFDGVPYVVVAFCKAHDCYDHSAVFLYSAAQKRVIGLVRQKGAKTILGARGPALASRLDRLWLKEWRQK